MKKVLITIIATLLPMLAMGQIIAEADFTTATEFTGWTQFDDSQTDGKVELQAGEGLAITVGIQTGQLWQPQIMVIPDGSFDLKEKCAYTVVVTAKFPTDGTLQINMGSWSANDLAQFPIETNGDFQVVECYFEDWSVDAEGAHLLFQCGDFKGTTILKSIEVWEGDALIYDKCTVEGDEALLGVDWDATKNKMYTLDGVNYKLTKNNIMLSKGTYYYKVIKEDVSYPNTNASLVIDEDAIYNINFTFNANTKEVSASASKTTGWTIAGDEALLGQAWDLTRNEMTSNDGANYTLTKTNLMLPKGTYEFKVYNKASTQESYPSSNATLVIDENAQYTVVFTFNVNTKQVSATATKTDGIYYNYITKGKIAEVIQNPNGYKGEIIIPEKVTHEGVEYTVKKINDFAFSGCSALTSVTIPNSVTSIGASAFQNCSLTSITIPNSVTSIGGYAFEGCYLTYVTFPNQMISIAGNAFVHCDNIENVFISDIDIWCEINSNGSLIFSPHHIYLNGDEIINLIIPNSITSINNAFANCAYIQSVNIGNGISSIGGSAFSNCTSLTSITIPSNVTSIGDAAFKECTSLTSVDFPSTLTSIEGGAFKGCTSLASIDLPSNLTSIGVGAFEGCTSLTSITIPNSVTNIRREVFWNCSSLASISIGNGVESIGSNAFANCSNLANVYCMVEDLSSLSTYASAFDDSYIEYATLHVPASAINAYKTTAPWSGFGEFKTLSGEVVETKKCATPTISYVNGEITFSCETDGVEYVSELSSTDVGNKYTDKVSITGKIAVKVYATKSGYLNSDTATAEIEVPRELKGDLNNDGKVDVADHVKLSSIIMDQNQ